MDCQLWDMDLVLGVCSGLQPDKQISISMHFLLILEKLLLSFAIWRRNRCFFTESSISNVLSTTIRAVGTPQSKKEPVGWALSVSFLLCRTAWAESWPTPAASVNTERGVQGHLHCALFYTEMYVLFSLKTWETFLLKVGLYDNKERRLILFSVTPFSSLALHSVEQF